MSMWETPARGDDTPQVTPARAVRAAAGDTCPTCGGAPGPGTTGRCRGCAEEEWTTLRAARCHLARFLVHRHSR